MSGEIFFAAAGMGQKARGQALVAKDGFSARYDLDRLRGVFSRPDHKLAGASYIGRVLAIGHICWRKLLTSASSRVQLLAKSHSDGRILLAGCVR